MSQLAPFTLANQFGIIRREVVASTIDALRVDTSAGQPNGCKLHTKVLRAPNNITGPKQRLMSQSLLDVETGNPLEIPAGSSISKFKVCKSSENVLDDNFAAVLGYLCSEINSKEAKKALAGRIAPVDRPVTGAVLNKHASIAFDQKLYPEQLAAQQKLFDEDDADQGEEVVALNYNVQGHTYVGESKALFPAITVLDGTLDVNDLVFVIEYELPISN